MYENQHQTYLDLKPIDIRRTELLQKDIPALKDKLEEEEEKRPVLVTQADTVGFKHFDRSPDSMLTYRHAW